MMDLMPNLRTTLLDLLYELRDNDLPLIIGGGYGIYLKREYIREQGMRRLLREWPESRSTNDIDLFLRPELLINSEQLRPLAESLLRLGYIPIPGAEKYQFVKPGPQGDVPGSIKIDLLTGPRARFENSKAIVDDRRVRPRPLPVEREQTNAALIELDSAGVVMEPRQQPPSCNTRLSVVARNALKPILGEDQVCEIEKQVEAGKLTLEDLNALAEQGLDISTGVVKLIFGTANPQEVALAFLHATSFDKEIEKKEANNELRQLLQISFEVELGAKESLENWRTKLGRHGCLPQWSKLC